MEYAWVEEGVLYIKRTPTFIASIPFMAIVSRSELLGFADPAETLDAILHIQDHGDPADRPKMRDCHWDAPTILLTKRERDREDVAERFLRGELPPAPSSMVLQSTLSAYKSVHVPVNDGECMMDRARRDSRTKLGLPDPSVKAGPSSRNLAVQSAMSVGSQDALDSTELLLPHFGELSRLKRQYLHSITGNTSDPFEVAAEQEEEKPRSEEEIVELYSKGGSLVS